MRMGFSFVVCALLAMAYWAETATDNTAIMFQTVIKQLMQLNKTVKQSDTSFLNSPTSDIKDCCYQSALVCFRDQLNKIPTSSKDLQRKLHKNLHKMSIVNIVSQCPKSEKDNTICDPCSSYPMIDSHKFLTNLLNLLQKSYSQLP